MFEEEIMKSHRNFSLSLALFLCVGITLVGCSKSSTDTENQSDSGQTASTTGAKSSGKRGTKSAANSAVRTSATPPAPVTLTIPAGTTIAVAVDQSLSSATSHTGDSFTATVVEPIMVGGKVAVPRDSRVSGTVVNAVSSGRLSKPGELSVKLDSFNANGSTYNISTTPISMKGGSHKNRDLAIIGGSSAGGALIGGLLGHGKGAAIGALAGAGGGTAGAMLTGKKDVSIASESRLNFALTQSVTVTLPPSSSGSAAASQ
jgi:hypothetical protein